MRNPNTLAMVVVLVALILIGIPISRSLGDDHDLTPMEKIQRGIYDPDAVVLTTIGFDTELNNGRMMDPKSPGLLYLAYLIEGYADFPEKVGPDRALPRLRASHKVGDSAFFTQLEPEQTKLLERIKTAAQKASERDRSLCAIGPQPALACP